jgi:hypothetical protein
MQEINTGSTDERLFDALHSALEVRGEESRARLMHESARVGVSTLLFDRFGRAAMQDRTKVVEQVEYLFRSCGADEVTRRHLALFWAFESLPEGDPSSETLVLFGELMKFFLADPEASHRFITAVSIKFKG